MAAPRRIPTAWLSRRSLRERIGLGLALLVFLVAVLLGGLIGKASELQARNRIGQSLAIDAQRLAERLTTELATRARELTLLSRMESLRTVVSTVSIAPSVAGSGALSVATAQTQALLDELKRSYPAYAWIGVATPAGRVIIATDAASVGTLISARGANRDGMRGPPPLPGAQDLPEDVRMIDLLQPIRDADGSVIGSIAAQLPWSWVRSIEKATITADDDSVIRRETFLVGARDNVVLGPPETAGVILNAPSVARARAGLTGWQVEPWPSLNPRDAQRSYLTGAAFAVGDGPGANVGVQGLRWSVLVREAEEQAFAPATVLRETIWGVGLLVAAVFALAGWMLAGMVTSPLARIAVAAERLRQGDDIEIPRIRGATEIDSLSTSLRALVATLTRKQEALDEMEELALHDPLTRLLNRHGLRLHLDAMLTQAKATGSSVMLFVGDLDGFKAVNDTMGHQTGDQLLCLVAARLKQMVRRGDLVARLGGDEFVLALPAPAGSQDMAAVAVAQRAQAAVMAPYQVGGSVVKVGCSLGGACWPDHLSATERDVGLMEGFERVLAHADSVLYDIKRTGKGRVDLFGAPRNRAGEQVP